MRDLKSPAERTQTPSESPATRRVAGLRDVMATRKIASRSAPATRSQQLSEIAWLDRELERLRREASILAANLARVNARVVEVDERRTLLMDIIRKDLGLEFAQPAARADVAQAEEPAAKVDQFSLEY